MARSILLFALTFGLSTMSTSFVLVVRDHPLHVARTSQRPTSNTVGVQPVPIRTTQLAATISQQEAQKNIDRVVAALRKDKTAITELGKLERVTVVLGYGSPLPDSIAVRFNASFRKSGMGRSAVPMPFMLGQTDRSEGRGTMVGQVKASVNAKTGKVTSCSVFRDLGYGRAFNLKC